MTWDYKFMRIAMEIASWSKHPKIKVGCVVVDDDHNQLAGGYNGLPRGASDSAIRDQSRTVSTTVHAEANAVASAARNGHSIKGATVYVTRPVCAQCAALLVQAGIKSVLFEFEGMFSATQPGLVRAEFHHYMGEWAESCIATYELFMEVGVRYRQFRQEDDSHTNTHAARELNSEGQPDSYTYWFDPRCNDLRCPSTHGEQRCQKFSGHPGPHQESNEVWTHE